MSTLLVKMSSFGDILHTLPAVEDAYRQKGLRFDWVLEPSFAPIAKLHPAVDDTIGFPLRAWRKTPFKSLLSKEFKSTIKTLRQKPYDTILDAQGLVKSALVAKLARGKRYGYDKDTAREGFASFAYDHTLSIDKSLHAVQKTRALFAKQFGYDYQSLPLSYGIDANKLPTSSWPDKSLLFLHGTTWDTKHWPVRYWQELTQIASAKGYQVYLPWGSIKEQQRALEISRVCRTMPKPIVLPKMSLLELAGMMLSMDAIVAVDTGLGHLACALDVPCLSVYGPTDPQKTGTFGNNQAHLSATKNCAPCLKRQCSLKGQFDVQPPCFKDVDPQTVWDYLQTMIQQPQRAQR